MTIFASEQKQRRESIKNTRFYAIKHLFYPEFKQTMQQCRIHC